MKNRLVINAYAATDSFGDVLRAALENAVRVDIAVSYLQMSGWHFLKKHFAGVQPKDIRVLTTDQLGITHPAVLTDAVRIGVHVKSYSGAKLYHPKVFLSYGSNGKPIRGVVGSANVSASGFESGIEAGIEVKDPSLLRQLHQWFDELYCDKWAKSVDIRFIQSYEKRWKSSSESRIRFRRMLAKGKKGGRTVITPTTEDLDALDDIFSTIQLPVATLGFDHAGNNIRNLSRVLEVLSRFPKVGDKERSELHLLGFLNGSGLTALGSKASAARSKSKIARQWCSWVRAAKEQSLAKRNARLVSFRRAAWQFWNLKREVRQFFLNNITSTELRSVLQTIELLCNGSDTVRNLSIEDFKSLSRIVLNPARLPEFLAIAVKDYLANKGSRSWTSTDRRIVLEAFNT